MFACCKHAKLAKTIRIIAQPKLSDFYPAKTIRIIAQQKLSDMCLAKTIRFFA
jgi:hypothetical protein